MAFALSKKLLLVALAVILIVASAAVWYFNKQESAEFAVVSEDGKAKLRIQESTLPVGVRLNDIHISKLSDEEIVKNFPQDKKQAEMPIAVYRMEPDGTMFNEPVPLEITLASGEDDRFMPTMFNFSKGKIEGIETKVERLASGNVKLSGNISHFSDVVVGFDFFGIGMPKDLGIHFVGESFTATVSLVKRDNYSFLDTEGNILSNTLKSDPVFIIGGYFSESEVSPILTPSRINDQPEEGSVMRRDEMMFQGEFTCAKPGRTTVYYSTALNYSQKYESSSLVDYLLSGTYVDNSFLSAEGKVECVEMPIELGPKLDVEVVCGGSADIRGSVAGDRERVLGVDIKAGGITRPANYNKVSGDFEVAVSLKPGTYGYDIIFKLTDGQEKTVTKYNSFYIAPCPDNSTSSIDIKPSATPLPDGDETGKKIEDSNPKTPKDQNLPDDQGGIGTDQPAILDICCYNSKAKVGEQYYIPFDGSGCLPGDQQVPLDKDCGNPLLY